MRNTRYLAAKIAGAGALALLLATSTFADDRPQDGTGRRGDHRQSGEVRGDRGDRHDRSGDTSRNNGYGDRQRIQADSPRGGDTRQPAAADRQRGRDNRQPVTSERQYDRRDGSNGNYRGGGERSRGGYGDRGPAVQQHRQYRDNERVHMGGHITRYAHERGGYRVWLDNGPYAFWVPEARWRNNWRVGISINIGGIFRGGTIYSDVYDDPYYNDPYYNDPYNDGGYGYSTDYLTGYVDRVDYRTGTLWLRDDRSGRIVAVDMRSVDRRYSRLDSRDLRRGDRITLTGSWLRGGLFGADRIDSVDTRY